MRVQGGGFITHQYDMQREEEEGRGGKNAGEGEGWNWLDEMSQRM